MLRMAETSEGFPRERGGSGGDDAIPMLLVNTAAVCSFKALHVKLSDKHLHGNFCWKKKRREGRGGVQS